MPTYSLLFKQSILLATGFFVSLGSQAVTYDPITVAQLNLWNANFSEPSFNPGFCADRSKRDTCSRAYQIIDLLNQGLGAPKTQYDIIMTEENSSKAMNAPPIDLTKDFNKNNLDNNKYVLCGKVNTGTVFYNKNRWKQNTVKYVDVTYNQGGGKGTRQITFCVLEPINPASPWVIAAATHWCVNWEAPGIKSTCANNTPTEAHKVDADTFKKNVDTLMASFPQAVAILGGDLNSMVPNEYKDLVKKMNSKTVDKRDSDTFGFLTGNPYKNYPADKETLLDTWAPNIVIDYIFYNPTSFNKMTTIQAEESKINPFNGLSDHKGAVVTKFDVQGK